VFQCKYILVTLKLSFLLTVKYIQIRSCIYFFSWFLLKTYNSRCRKPPGLCASVLSIRHAFRAVNNSYC